MPLQRGDGSRRRSSIHKYGKSCICGNTVECKGISSAFKMMGDPRKGYVPMPAHIDSPVLASEKEQNLLRAAYIRHLNLSVDDQKKLLNRNSSKSSDTHFVALHHFHPSIVLSFAKNFRKKNPVPTTVRKDDVELLNMALSEQDRVTDEEGNPTDYYYFAPSYSTDQAKEDVKQLVRSSRTQIEQRSSVVLERSSSAASLSSLLSGSTPTTATTTTPTWSGDDTDSLASSLSESTRSLLAPTPPPTTTTTRPRSGSELFHAQSPLRQGEMEDYQRKPVVERTSSSSSTTTTTRPVVQMDPPGSTALDAVRPLVEPEEDFVVVTADEAVDTTDPKVPRDANHDNDDDDGADDNVDNTQIGIQLSYELPSRQADDDDNDESADEIVVLEAEDQQDSSSVDSATQLLKETLSGEAFQKDDDHPSSVMVATDQAVQPSQETLSSVPVEAIASSGKTENKAQMPDTTEAIDTNKGSSPPLAEPKPATSLVSREIEIDTVQPETKAVSSRDPVLFQESNSTPAEEVEIHNDKQNEAPVADSLRESTLGQEGKDGSIAAAEESEILDDNQDAAIAEPGLSEQTIAESEGIPANETMDVDKTDAMPVALDHADEALLTSNDAGVSLESSESNEVGGESTDDSVGLPRGVELLTNNLVNDEKKDENVVEDSTMSHVPTSMALEVGQTPEKENATIAEKEATQDLVENSSANTPVGQSDGTTIKISPSGTVKQSDEELSTNEMVESVKDVDEDASETEQVAQESPDEGSADTGDTSLTSTVSGSSQGSEQPKLVGILKRSRSKSVSWDEEGIAEYTALTPAAEMAMKAKKEKEAAAASVKLSTQSKQRTVPVVPFVKTKPTPLKSVVRESTRKPMRAANLKAFVRLDASGYSKTTRSVQTMNTRAAVREQASPVMLPSLKSSLGKLNGSPANGGNNPRPSVNQEVAGSEASSSSFYDNVMHDLPILVCRRIVCFFLHLVVRQGSLQVREGDSLVQFGDALDTKPVTMKILNPWFFVKAAFEHDIGLARSYMAGHFVIERASSEAIVLAQTDESFSSDDPLGMKRLFALMIKNRDNHTKDATLIAKMISIGSGMALSRVSSIFAYLRYAIQTGSSYSLSIKKLHTQYDLSNHFIHSTLDKLQCMYSAAIYDMVRSPSDGTIAFKGTLEEAQMRKLALLAQRARLTPGSQTAFLDVGGSWGGGLRFSIYVAKTLGCQVTVLVSSTDEMTLVEKQVRASDLSRLVSVEMAKNIVEFANIAENQHKFDRVLSYDWLHSSTYKTGSGVLRQYFGALERVLAPNGIIMMEAITRAGRYYYSASNLLNVIFPPPQSYSPSLEILRTEARTSSGLNVSSVDYIGVHYAQTAAHWRERGYKQGGVLDAVHLRAWNYYLSYCEAGFSSQTVDYLILVIEREITA